MENSPESHSPVERGNFRDQSNPRSGEVEGSKPDRRGRQGAILATASGYSTRRGGSDDGAMAGVEGNRIRTPSAVE